MNKIAVISAVRSPIGKIPGELNYINETELLSKVFKEAAKGFENIIDEAIVGSSFPVERDNLCRKALLESGLPFKISCSTISKTCASSDEALNIAWGKIRSGKSKAVLVGGSEKISNSSYTLHFMKRNIKRSVKNIIPYFQDIEDKILENDMVYICEMLSRKHGISRKAQDDFTVKSIDKAVRANNEGLFKDEIICINYERDGQNYSLGTDEMLLNERAVKDIYNAAPMFLKDGSLTQYNAAPMCDCSAGMLIMDFEYAKNMNIKPLAIIEDTVSMGVPEDRTGHAMGGCIESILSRNSLKKEDMDLFEINESFAAQAIFVINSLGIDMDKVNVKGGNLALGYPIGTTGLRMNISLLHEMKRRNTRLGLSVMCAGGHMANAALFSRA